MSTITIAVLRAMKGGAKMITLWGVWHCNENRWLGGLPDPWLYSDSKDAEATVSKMSEGGADYVGCLVVRLYGQFVRVPPEVMQAVEAIRGQVTSTLCPHELEILNWAAQAVGEGGG